MTASTRFIGLAIFTWAGVRAVSLGLIPGASAFTLGDSAVAASRPAVALPPIERTQLAPIEVAGDNQSPAAGAEPAPASAVPQAGPVSIRLVPARRAATSRGSAAYAWPSFDRSEARSRVPRTLAEAEADLPPARKVAFGAAPLTTALPVARPIGSGPATDRGGLGAVDSTAAPLLRHSRKLELSSWALMRGKPGEILGPNTLAASSGTLGGSQAGARLNYWVTPHFAASLRSSTPLGGARGGEVAAGIRYQPFLHLPFSVTAERRQRFGRAGGRNDFALFAEGGVWNRPMPFGFRLDGYAQAGVVGIRTHDLFGDGAFTLTRPLWRNLSGGFGVWAGAQPHLYRVDAGPRLTIQMRKSMRIHLDYRQRLAGSALPASGPAVTIAGDF